LCPRVCFGWRYRGRGWGDVGWVGEIASAGEKDEVDAKTE